MYLDFFNLTSYPFQLAPDSDFLYPSKAHARAKAYLEYAIWNRDGFVVITGAIGSGKTILVKKLLSELPPSVVAAKISQTQVNEIEFLRLLHSEFGIESFNSDKAELLNTLKTFLLDQHEQHNQVVLIVDEAQNLAKRVLEEIRLLSGLDNQNESLLNVILLGQSELGEKLDLPNMQQLAQRLKLRFHIKPLSRLEAAEYIEHRLKVAGAPSPGLFPPETIPLIYRYTGGVPRLINVLCDTVLTAAFVENTERVSTHLVNLAIEELQWVPYSERAGKPRRRKSDSILVDTDETRITHRSNSPRPRANGADERFNRLYAFLPKFAQISVEKMKGMDEQLRQIIELLQDRK